MREFLIDTFSIFSVYEGAILFATPFLLMILLSAYSFYTLKSRNLVYIFILSFLSQLLIFTSISYLIQYSFGAVTNGFIQIAFYISVMIWTISSSLLFSQYKEEAGKKRFDPDHVTRAHFRSILDNGVVITLVSLALMVFLSRDHRIVITTAFISSLLTLALTHLIARWLLKEKSKRKNARK